MKPFLFNNFGEAISQAENWLHYKSELVHSGRWQGINIKNKPEMATHEITHISFGVRLDGEELLNQYREDIKPNLPWADNHFKERVCGVPINPGLEWKNWPYNKSAETFLEGGFFNHNYMERYWPKYAGMLEKPTESPKDYVPFRALGPHRGIRYRYGDLNDVVNLLCEDPYTRQAYLPIWFPEDTGGGSKRAPCSIGYHFLMRNKKLSINYEIRSCDFIRHFRDDCYLTVRLLLWVLEECRRKDSGWENAVPGNYYMQIGSLHIFRNDYQVLFG